MKGIGAFFLAWLLPLAAIAAPDASFVVYRGGSPGSKPAPLYVHFDATATTSSIGSDVAKRDLRFEWDFGDPSSGNWETNGLSRNRAIGFVAGHVYANAGTYTVTLTVTDRNGAIDTAQQNVVVDNPDTVWSATTACVSSSGTFTGCPAGASQLTSADFTVAMQNRVGAGARRILFRRGETFVANSCYGTPNQRTEALVSAFGSGAVPNIQIAAGNTDCAVRFNGSSINTATAGGWRFVDLKISSVSTTNLAWGFKTSFIFDDVLIYRMDIGPTGLGFNFGPDQSGLNTPHRHYALVDTQLRGNTGTPVSNPGSCYFGGASHQFISGVVCGQANNWQMRIAYTHKGVISNNIIAERAGAFEAIKLHCSIGAINANPGAICADLIFSDNILAKERLTIASGGNDLGTIEDSIFERNLIPGGIVTINPRNVHRFNVLGGFLIGPRNEQGYVDAAQARGNIFESNTCDLRSSPVSCVSMNPGAKYDGLVLRNNLAYNPGGSARALVADNSGNPSSITQQGNVSTNVIPWAVASPNPLVRANYALASGSNRINAGATGVSRLFDLLGNPTPVGSPDQGAVETQEGAPPPQCDENSDCADGDQCTRDICAAGTCTNPIGTGDVCSDGNAGTINDVCSALGVCAGTPVECTENSECADSNPCTVDACVANACTHPNAANGTTCDDGNPSTTQDQCTSGTCAGSIPACVPADCNDNNQCTADSCLLGVCMNAPRTGQSCNDGSAATQNDVCLAGPPPMCMGVTPPPPPPPVVNRPAKPTNVRITQD